MFEGEVLPPSEDKVEPVTSAFILTWIVPSPLRNAWSFPLRERAPR